MRKGSWRGENGVWGRLACQGREVPVWRSSKKKTHGGERSSVGAGEIPLTIFGVFVLKSGLCFLVRGENCQQLYKLL